LYKVNRYTNDHNCPFVEYGLRVNTNEHERQIQDNYKTRTNIVISDMDTTNTCDRPLIKLLRIYCCDWNCQSPIFKKFQVSFISTCLIRFESYVKKLREHSSLLNGEVLESEPDNRSEDTLVFFDD